MLDEPWDPLSALALAVLAVGTAVALKLTLPPATLSDAAPLLLFYAAVVGSAWHGGARAGVPAALLSVAAAAFFLPHRNGHEETAVPWALVLFLGETLFAVAVCEHLRERRRRAENGLQQLTRQIEGLRDAGRVHRALTAGLTTLSRLGTALAADLEADAVAVLAAEGAAAITQAPWVALSFQRFVSSAEPLRAAVGFAEVPCDAAALRSVLGGGSVLRLADVLHEAALASLNTEKHPVRSALVARVDGRSGFGVFLLGRPRPDEFRAEDELLLGILAAQTASALDNAQHHTDAQRASEAAQTAGRLKDEFLSTLSHELRTPLNAIVGWAHLLRSHKLDSNDTHRAVETIARNASLQESMIEELLDMSSLLNGQLRLQSEPLDARDPVEDAVATGQGYARAKGVELLLAVPPEPVMVNADPSRLRQIAWSLISNGIKFTPAGGRVEVRLGSAAEATEIVVSDTGSGMDPDFLSRLFSRFSRADASSTRLTRGLGLGLSVTRGLVELHGGQLLAESAGQGQGSKFTIRLPTLASVPDPRSEADALAAAGRSGAA